MRRFIVSCLILLLTLATKANAELTAKWSTSVAVPGEEVLLFIISDPAPPLDGDKIIVQFPYAVKGASCNGGQSVTKTYTAGDGTNREIMVWYLYVRPDGPGTLNVPPVECYNSQKRVKVNVPPLTVRPTMDITWRKTPFKHGVLWHCDQTEGYEHQPVKATFKIFLPNESVRWLGDTKPIFPAPDLENGEFRHYLIDPLWDLRNGAVQKRTVTAEGQEWVTLEYTGTFTPTKPNKRMAIHGKVGLAKTWRGNKETTVITLPPLKLAPLPLPPKAPKNFANIVGTYQITAKTQADSLAMNEAVEVEITLRGTGDLDRMKCPAPMAAENWKLGKQTVRKEWDANRETQYIVFSQVMYPTAEVSGIPAFGFCCFDPEKQEYTTVSSDPIPLQWRQTSTPGEGVQTSQIAEPPPAGTVPVAEMTDIYSTYLPSCGGILHRIPRWVCYLLYLPAIGIFLTMLGLYIHRRVAAGASGRALDKELGTIGNTEEGLAFLKGIGAFIESHIPGSDMTPELRGILQKRDSLAFRPDAKAETISPMEKQTMLKHVRQAIAKAGKTATLLVAALMLLGGGMQAAESEADQASQTAYEAGQFSDCLKKLQPIIGSDETATAEAWYNAGNCHYRLNKPGKAALCYARALCIKPWLREAKDNLAFIQRKEGSILPSRSTSDEVFTFLSAGQLWLATVFSTSMLALCIALQVWRRKQHRPWLHTGTAVTAALCILCAVDHVYYSTREIPDITSLQPQDMAYVVTACEARSAADTEAASVVALPVATPVHLLARRGLWAYVETFTGVRGWIPSKCVESLYTGEADPTTPVYIKFD